MEPRLHTQMQIFQVHHGQQRGIADTQFTGNAENFVSSKRLEETSAMFHVLDLHAIFPCLVFGISCTKYTYDIHNIYSVCSIQKCKSQVYTSYITSLTYQVLAPVTSSPILMSSCMRSLEYQNQLHRVRLARCPPSHLRAARAGNEYQ